MGAKTWMLVYADKGVDPRIALAHEPAPDRGKTDAFVSRLFPADTVQREGDVDLSDTCPRGRDVHAGWYDGVRVVASKEIALDHPSTLPKAFIDEAGDGDLYLHAMHSTVDWLAFAIWKQGRLVRALSLSPESGLLENIGEPLDFERPYWQGAHPVFDEDSGEDPQAYPFVFHPLELGEAALKAYFGYQLEGVADDSLVAPERVALFRYTRRPARPWWKFWA